MTALFAKLWGNRHTSIAAVIYAAAKFGCPIAATWAPNHKAQIESTANILEALAIFYGFAAAGDAVAASKPKPNGTATPPVTTEPPKP